MRLFTVFLPVMPIGVEHRCLLSGDHLLNTRSVFLPVMPIGVEHYDNDFLCIGEAIVFLPVMPIGVEHLGSEGLVSIF